MDPGDYDLLLDDWPYKSGVVSARQVMTRGGRPVVQVRVELGILQMELEGRPDGARPEGCDSYLDYLTKRRFAESDLFELSDEDRYEIDHEIAIYNQRRLGLMALRDFRRTAGDARHVLDLLLLIAEVLPEDEWMIAHLRYLPLVIFHHIQASAMEAIIRSGPEAAIDCLDEGKTQLESLYESPMSGEEGSEVIAPFIEQLDEMAEGLRSEFHIGRTLAEQLEEAIAKEQYELAAKIRDEMARRGGHGGGSG